MKKINVRKSIRTDGLENVLSRKGTSSSKSGSKRFTASNKLPAHTIRSIYESGGVGAKIITRVADDITRKGFEIKDSNGEALIKKFNKLKGTSIFNQAIRWARAYGGSLIIMDVEDGKDLESPLLPKSGGHKINSLKVYEAGNTHQVQVESYIEDKYNSNYGDPEIYNISGADGSRFSIHSSRVIRLDGRPLDTISRSKNNGWDGSELDVVYDSLLSMFSQLMSGEQVLDEMVIGTLKVENLDALCVDSEGEALLRKRMNLVDTSKSIENTIVIDINESYERHSVNLSGMSNLQQNAMTLVAGAADIPATFLYGSSPDGQNATGESDREQYFGKIDAERLYFYKPAILQLFEIMSGSDDLDITFPDLGESNFYDTARGFNHVTKGFSDMVEAEIITREEASKMFYESGVINKITMSS
jgi:uncharacterized protein